MRVAIFLARLSAGLTRAQPAGRTQCRTPFNRAIVGCRPSRIEAVIGGLDRLHIIGPGIVLARNCHAAAPHFRAHDRRDLAGLEPEFQDF